MVNVAHNGDNRWPRRRTLAGSHSHALDPRGRSPSGPRGFGPPNDGPKRLGDAGGHLWLDLLVDARQDPLVQEPLDDLAGRHTKLGRQLADRQRTRQLDLARDLRRDFDRCLFHAADGRTAPLGQPVHWPPRLDLRTAGRAALTWTPSTIARRLRAGRRGTLGRRRRGRPGSRRAPLARGLTVWLPARRPDGLD